MNKRIIKEKVGVAFLRLGVIITGFFLLSFLYIIFSQGASVLTWEFLTDYPREAMTKGGIFPALLGTLYLTLLSIAIALPLGVLTAIYMVHFAKPYWLMRGVRIAVNTLAGIPSIIYGLFGLTLFVRIMNFDVSLLSGSLTLAILVLPVIINTSEEALRGVPASFRQGSLALGATERQTVMRVIVPTALPNILTGAIISIGRVAGETAPVMFTAVTFYSRVLPTSVKHEVMALPYHVYALMTEGAKPEQQVPIAYGTALVLLILVLMVSATAIIIRYRIRKSRHW